MPTTAPAAAPVDGPSACLAVAAGSPDGPSEAFDALSTGATARNEASAGWASMTSGAGGAVALTDNTGGRFKAPSAAPGRGAPDGDVADGVPKSIRNVGSGRGDAPPSGSRFAGANELRSNARVTGGAVGIDAMTTGVGIAGPDIAGAGVTGTVDPRPEGGIVAAAGMVAIGCADAGIERTAAVGVPAAPNAGGSGPCCGTAGPVAMTVGGGRGANGTTPGFAIGTISPPRSSSNGSLTASGGIGVGTGIAIGAGIWLGITCGELAPLGLPFAPGIEPNTSFNRADNEPGAASATGGTGSASRTGSSAMIRRIDARMSSMLGSA